MVLFQPLFFEFGPRAPEWGKRLPALLEFVKVLHKCLDTHGFYTKIIRYEELSGLRLGSSCAVVDTFSVAVARE